MQKQYIYPLFIDALEKTGVLNINILAFDKPGNPEFGDLSTNIALQLAKQLKKPPRILAQEIISNIVFDNKLIEKIDIAGAGFINIKFTNMFYTKALENLAEQAENIGKQKIGASRKVNVEYVSVNPTGLLHLGHGRNAAIGDTIANLYEWLGYSVTREYYFNNAGNQMNMLAKSIFARYKQLIGEADFPFPDDGYHGDYIIDIAQEVLDSYGTKLNEGTYQDLSEIKKYGEGWCFEQIRKTLNRMNIKQNVYFNEDSLYKTGKITKVIEDLKAKDIVYEKEGATWLAFSKLGLKDDRVIVKSTGEPTYRLPDIAYHREKFERGYDLIVDVFGADHIATVPDVMAALKALGYNTSIVKVIVYQFVTLTENGEQVKMSKRSGKVYTLDELLDEVGTDVVRYFLIMRGTGTHLEFDLALAKEQSDKNPVFYLQYAYARINSIFDKARENSIELKKNVNYDMLSHITEINLIKVLLKFNETLQLACEKGEPQILAEYLQSLATAFHAFYHECRILGVEEDLLQARLKLAQITKFAMKNGLTILGISVPDRM